MGTPPMMKCGRQTYLMRVSVRARARSRVRVGVGVAVRVGVRANPYISPNQADLLAFVGEVEDASQGG